MSDECAGIPFLIFRIIKIVRIFVESVLFSIRKEGKHENNNMYWKLLSSSWVQAGY